MSVSITFTDINDNVYTLSHMYGVYTLKDEDGGLVNYGTNVERLVGETLGHHAVQNCLESMEAAE